jgi:hypothetical protein
VDLFGAQGVSIIPHMIRQTENKGPMKSFKHLALQRETWVPIMKFHIHPLVMKHFSRTLLVKEHTLVHLDSVKSLGNHWTLRLLQWGYACQMP